MVKTIVSEEAWTLIYFLFIIGLVLVVFGSNLFVDCAVRLARRFRMSEMLIGATLVSIGTTLPELIVSATASFEGHPDMAAGNAIGSIICNTALIAGFVQAVRPSKPETRTFRESYTVFFMAAGIYCLFAYTAGGFSRVAGIMLLLILAVYLWWSGTRAKNERKETLPEEVKGSVVVDFLLLALTAAALFFGARLLVENGSEIAQLIGIPEHVISVSMIALGTSLPELITAIAALRKKHIALSLGNVIGANILNLLMVSGTASVISPVPVSSDLLRLDIPMMLTASLLLALPGIFRKKLYRWQGISLLLLYVAYLSYIYIVR